MAGLARALQRETDQTTGIYTEDFTAQRIILVQFSTILRESVWMPLHLCLQDVHQEELLDLCIFFMDGHDVAAEPMPHGATMSGLVNALHACMRSVREWHIERALLSAAR